MPIEFDPTLASILTLAGAAIAAPLVTTFVEMMKRLLPVIEAHRWEQAIALATSLVLVIVASIDRHMTIGQTTLNDGFVSFVAWLAIAKLATGVYDEATSQPSSFRSST